MPPACRGHVLRLYQNDLSAPPEKPGGCAAGKMPQQYRSNALGANPYSLIAISYFFSQKLICSKYAIHCGPAISCPNHGFP